MREAVVELDRGEIGTAMSRAGAGVETEARACGTSTGEAVLDGVGVEKNEGL